MTLPSALLDPSVCISLVVAFTTGYVIYQIFLSPLASVPGPLLGKITTWYQVYLSMRGNVHRDLVELHEKYGSVVRMGPNTVSVVDPEAFREIYKAGGRFKKSATYDVIKGKRTFDLAGERNEKVHGEQRRLVARAYSMDSTVYLEPKFDEILLQTLDQLARTSGFTDLGTWVQLFAFDVIGAISFSKPFGYVAAGTDNGLFMRLQRAFASLSWLRYVRWFYSLHQALMPVIGNWLAANDRNGYFFNFANDQIQLAKGHSDTKDIMSQLFTTQQTKPELNDKNIAFMLTSNVFAGSDTTSSALRGILYLLLTNPQYYDLLVKEAEERAAEGKLSYPVKFNEAEAWPLLQGIIYEGMRLLPSVGQVLYRDVPAGGLKCGDYWIPAGTMVGTSPWPLHRSREIWGADVEEFRPERWLGPEASELKRYFFGFGGGSRTCLGRNISWLEMSKFIPTLLMRFNLELEPNARLTEYCGSLLFFNGLKVRLTPRTNESPAI
ncbi:cytochrome P450 [Penicillium herquei]|nr:cytochrome P450 [Penicillium herquei]